MSDADWNPDQVVSTSAAALPTGRPRSSSSRLAAASQGGRGRRGSASGDASIPGMPPCGRSRRLLNLFGKASLLCLPGRRVATERQVLPAWSRDVSVPITALSHCFDPPVQLPCKYMQVHVVLHDEGWRPEGLEAAAAALQQPLGSSPPPFEQDAVVLGATVSAAAANSMPGAGTLGHPPAPVLSSPAAADGAVMPMAAPADSATTWGDGGTAYTTSSQQPTATAAPAVATPSTSTAAAPDSAATAAAAAIPAIPAAAAQPVAAGNPTTAALPAYQAAAQQGPVDMEVEVSAADAACSDSSALHDGCCVLRTLVVIRTKPAVPGAWVCGLGGELCQYVGWTLRCWEGVGQDVLRMHLVPSSPPSGSSQPARSQQQVQVLLTSQRSSSSDVIVDPSCAAVAAAADALMLQEPPSQCLPQQQQQVEGDGQQEVAGDGDVLMLMGADIPRRRRDYRRPGDGSSGAASRPSRRSHGSGMSGANGFLRWYKACVGSDDEDDTQPTSDVHTGRLRRSSAGLTQPAPPAAAAGGGRRRSLSEGFMAEPAPSLSMSLDVLAAVAAAELALLDTAPEPDQDGQYGSHPQLVLPEAGVPPAVAAWEGSVAAADQSSVRDGPVLDLSLPVAAGDAALGLMTAGSGVLRSPAGPRSYPSGATGGSGGMGSRCASNRSPGAGGSRSSVEAAVAAAAGSSDEEVVSEDEPSNPFMKLRAAAAAATAAGKRSRKSSLQAADGSPQSAAHGSGDSGLTQEQAGSMPGSARRGKGSRRGKQSDLLLVAPHIMRYASHKAVASVNKQTASVSCFVLPSRFIKECLTHVTGSRQVRVQVWVPSAAASAAAGAPTGGARFGADAAVSPSAADATAAAAAAGSLNEEEDSWGTAVSPQPAAQQQGQAAAGLGEDAAAGLSDATDLTVPVLPPGVIGPLLLPAGAPAVELASAAGVGAAAGGTGVLAAPGATAAAVDGQGTSGSPAASAPSAEASAAAGGGEPAVAAPFDGTDSGATACGAAEQAQLQLAPTSATPAAAVTTAAAAAAATSEAALHMPEVSAAAAAAPGASMEQQQQLVGPGGEAMACVRDFSALLKVVSPGRVMYLSGIQRRLDAFLGWRVIYLQRLDRHSLVLHLWPPMPSPEVPEAADPATAIALQQAAPPPSSQNTPHYPQQLLQELVLPGGALMQGESSFAAAAAVGMLGFDPAGQAAAAASERPSGSPVAAVERSLTAATPGAAAALAHDPLWALPPNQGLLTRPGTASPANAGLDSMLLSALRAAPSSSAGPSIDEAAAAAAAYGRRQQAGVYGSTLLQPKQEPRAAEAWPAALAVEVPHGGSSYPAAVDAPGGHSIASRRAALQQQLQPSVAPHHLQQQQQRQAVAPPSALPSSARVPGALRVSGKGPVLLSSSCMQYVSVRRIQDRMQTLHLPGSLLQYVFPHIQEDGHLTLQIKVPAACSTAGAAGQQVGGDASPAAAGAVEVPLAASGLGEDAALGPAAAAGDVAMADAGLAPPTAAVAAGCSAAGAAQQMVASVDGAQPMQLDASTQPAAASAAEQQTAAEQPASAAEPDAAGAGSEGSSSNGPPGPPMRLQEEVLTWCTIRHNSTCRALYLKHLQGVLDPYTSWRLIFLEKVAPFTLALHLWPPGPLPNCPEPPSAAAAAATTAPALPPSLLAAAGDLLVGQVAADGGPAAAGIKQEPVAVEHPPISQPQGVEWAPARGPLLRTNSSASAGAAAAAAAEGARRPGRAAKPNKGNKQAKKVLQVNSRMVQFPPGRKLTCIDRHTSLTQLFLPKSFFKRCCPELLQSDQVRLLIKMPAAAAGMVAGSQGAAWQQPQQLVQEVQPAAAAASAGPEAVAMLAAAATPGLGVTPGVCCSVEVPPGANCSCMEGVAGAAAAAAGAGPVGMDVDVCPASSHPPAVESLLVPQVMQGAAGMLQAPGEQPGLVSGSAGAPVAPAAAPTPAAAGAGAGGPAACHLAEQLAAGAPAQAAAPAAEVDPAAAGAAAGGAVGEALEGGCSSGSGVAMAVVGSNWVDLRGRLEGVTPVYLSNLRRQLDSYLGHRMVFLELVDASTIALHIWPPNPLRHVPEPPPWCYPNTADAAAAPTSCAGALWSGPTAAGGGAGVTGAAGALQGVSAQGPGAAAGITQQSKQQPKFAPGSFRTRPRKRARI